MRPGVEMVESSGKNRLDRRVAALPDTETTRWVEFFGVHCRSEVLRVVAIPGIQDSAIGDSAERHVLILLATGLGLSKLVEIHGGPWGSAEPVLGVTSHVGGNLVESALVDPRVRGWQTSNPSMAIHPR